MVEVKKGLRNPLDEAQVRKAVVALQSFVERRKADRAKQPLVESAEALSCILTRKVVPGKASLKPIQIDIPHSLYGGEGGAEMCLFVKDDDKQRIKEALAQDPVAGLTKVMTVKKLRKNFSRFEDKRTLAGAYDLFLADDRVLPYLKAPLGTKFFVKKKQPLAVRVSRKNVSFSIRAVAHRTAMHVSTGACCNVKVARLDMTVDEMVDNVMVAMNNCAAHIPKGWGGVQSISLKTSDSIALPVFNALAPLSKLPPVSKAEALTKRKLEEVEVEEPVEEPAAKKVKKAGKKVKHDAAAKNEEKESKKAGKKVKHDAAAKDEEKKTKKTGKKVKQVAEPAVQQKKSKKSKKAEGESESDVKPSPAKKHKVKQEEPVAEAPKEESKPSKKAKKARAAPAEADAADKKKKKRKHAAKN